MVGTPGYTKGGSVGSDHPDMNLAGGFVFANLKGDVTSILPNLSAATATVSKAGRDPGLTNHL